MRGELVKALLKFLGSSAVLFGLFWFWPDWYLVPVAHLSALASGMTGKLAAVGSVTNLVFFLEYQGLSYRIAARFVLLGLPVLLPLFIATPGFPWRTEWKRVLAAGVIVFVVHVLIAVLIFHMLIGRYAHTPGMEPLEIVMLVFIAINKLLPVGLWFALGGRDIVFRTGFAAK